MFFNVFKGMHLIVLIKYIANNQKRFLFLKNRILKHIVKYAQKVYTMWCEQNNSTPEIVQSYISV